MFKHIAFSLFLTASPALAGQITAADFPPVNPLKAELGQLLFYDKILSGNRNISCGSCHSHEQHSGDGLSLGIGEGGTGSGAKRTAGEGANRIHKRIPRNAPALWNLAHKDMTVFFHDGRLTKSEIFGNGFKSPAEERLPQGLDNLIAAQALFPITAQHEMAGNPKENEVAGAVHDRIDNAWPIITARITAIEGYNNRFIAAFDHIERSADITIVDVANAMSAFIGSEWANYDSPYDLGTLTPAAQRGQELFMGKGNCSSCHSGALFSDQSFHAIGLPSFGPGRTRAFDPIPRDVGHMGETDALEDAYKFRTPALRNVALTGPYGHNGAYDTLEGIVRHHLDPLMALDYWTPETAKLPKVEWLQNADFILQQDSREMARQRNAISITPVAMTDQEVADIVAFLNGLTGTTALERPLGRPETVPSRLPVQD